MRRRARRPRRTRAATSLICRWPARASARCSPPIPASTSPASSKAPSGAYRMILEAFWKGDLDAIRPHVDAACVRDVRRRGRAARQGRPHARQPPGRDRAGGDRRSRGGQWRGDRHRPLRGRHRRGHPQCRGRGGRRLDERRGPDPRPLDLPPRHRSRAIPTGCWSKPTRKSEGAVAGACGRWRSRCSPPAPARQPPPAPPPRRRPPPPAPAPTPLPVPPPPANAVAAGVALRVAAPA